MPRSPLSERDADGLDDLEELGDDAIIAQQTAAHAPRPRTAVTAEPRSVVISDDPRLGAQPRAKSTGEATLVIRDRRALDDLRSSILLGKAKKARSRRAFYVWGALGLSAFILGGISAFLATENRSERPADQGLGSTRRSEAPVAATTGSANSPPASRLAPSISTASPLETVRAVRLDELPVEPAPRH